MKMKSLAAAIALTIVPVSSVFAAALDRSGQSIAAFLQPGNYAEISGSSLNPTVEGKDNSGNATGDMADTYNFWSAALKVQPTDYFSFGLIFDEPFGADATYHGNNNFVTKPTDSILSIGGRSLPILVGGSVPGALGLNTAISGGTHVEVNSKSISALFGLHPAKGINLYAGPVYQRVEGEVNLRGSAYSLYNGYDADIHEDSAWGWLAGAAYEIPEIALKASLTYRSEIDHNARTDETVPLVGAVGANAAQISGLITRLVTAGAIDAATAARLGGAVGSLAGSSLQAGTTAITTPQSVNLDFQTGVMADTVAFANVRWVEWSKFAIQPKKFGQLSKAVGSLIGQPNGFNLVDYSDDQWSANVGVGRKVNDHWAGNVSVGWDSGAGNPVTTLGPTEGYWNVGLGVRYSPTPKVELSGGVKYFWLGDADAKVSSGTVVGDFSDNNAVAVGLKLGYRF